MSHTFDTPVQPLLSAEQLYAITHNSSPNTVHQSSSYNTGGIQPHNATLISNQAISPHMQIPNNTTPVKPIRKTYTITRERVEWKPQEHALFVEGLALYERDWKKIYEHIGCTKSIVQIRSHAQKHFIKLAKKGQSDAIPAPKVRRKRNELDHMEQLRNNFENNNLNGNIQLTDLYGTAMSRSASFQNGLPGLAQYRSQSAEVNELGLSRMHAALHPMNTMKSMTAPNSLPPRPPQCSISPSYSMPLSTMYPQNYTVQSSANISPFNVSPQPLMNAQPSQPQYSSILPVQSQTAAAATMPYSVSMYSGISPMTQQGNYMFSNNEITNNTVDTGVNLPVASLQIYVARLKTMNQSEQMRHLLLLSANDRNVAMQMLQAEVSQQQQLLPTLQEQSGMFNQQLLAANNQLPYAEATQNYPGMQYRDYAQVNPYASAPYMYNSAVQSTY